MSKSVFMYRGVMVIAPNESLETAQACKDRIDLSMKKADFLPSQNYKAIDKPVLDYTQEFPMIKTNSDDFIDVGSFDDETEEEETVTEDKPKRAKKPVSKLYELLPQVFKKTGKVNKHPINGKAPSKEAREIYRKALKFSQATTIMIVLPVGVCELSGEFKSACVNSMGEDILDLVLEEMMMQGWTIRGVSFNKNDGSIVQYE